MKKTLLLALMASTAVGAMADLNGNDFYRAQNAISKRYTYLLDNKGSINVGTTSADVYAIELYQDAERVISDPSTIFYISNPTGSQYNIAGQGTDLYSFLESYVKIIPGKEVDGQTTYYIYASKGGMSKYLGDLSGYNEGDEGWISVDAKGDNRLWYINPVLANTDNYFGLAPSVAANDKFYQPLYASFPMAPYSEGLTFYVVNEIDAANGIVRIAEVQGNVPAGVPVIAECSATATTDNRVSVGPSGENASIPVNYLQGVYFDNDMKTHYNRTPFDKEAMRVLANVDGNLMFVKGDLDFVPRNEAYLLLPEGDARNIDSYRVLKEGESGVKVIEADGMVEVYRIDGTLVSSSMPKSEVNSLPGGLYLLRSGDVCEKHLVH